MGPQIERSVRVLRPCRIVARQEWVVTIVFAVMMSLHIRIGQVHIEAHSRV
jgi:hypothetical protein